MTIGRGRPAAVTAVALVALVVVVFSGYRLGLRPESAGTAQSSCPGGLRSLERRNEKVDSPVVILVDVPANTKAVSRLIARNLEPVLRDQLERGASLEVVYDFGTGTDLIRDECLDGERFFESRAENVQRRAQDVNLAAAAASDRLRRTIEQSVVEPTGSPLRLLLFASDADDGEPPAHTVIWSDFLPNADDCVRADGPATSATITAIVDRCRQQGLLRPLNELTILGAGLGPRATGIEYWARDLATAFCEAIASECRIRA